MAYTQEEYAQKAHEANMTGKVLEVVDGEFVLAEPQYPEPTSFEKIAEAQQPFLEQQNLAKNDFVTARIEGDTKLEAEAQSEYQASVEAMKQATAEVAGE